MKPTCALSEVLEKHVRSLCLKDFPCGKGNWRGSSTLERSNTGANTEELDALLDLLIYAQSPWKYEGLWSDQASALRELSVRKPECLSDSFVYTFLTSIRLVGQKVSLIDKGLLHFSKLKKLVLSVNCITDIPLQYFPTTLQMLEFHANEISSLKGVSNHQLPSLQHLGLGRNPLGSIEDLQYISSSHWPQLVSLDLSWCEFERLGAMLEALSTLPFLRALVLEANPLTLTPAYPGLLIDQLSRLLYLDGSWIGSLDRENFKGMATLKDLVLDEAVVKVSIGTVKGVPQPPVSQSSAAADFPLISYSYLVTYQFLTNKIQGAVLGLDLKDQETPNRSQGEEMPHGIATTDTTISLDALLMIETRDESGNSLPVMKHSSRVHSWAEAMDLKHCDTHVVRDLFSLKSFLLQGLFMSVVEEKVTSWPATSSESPVNKSAVDKKGSAKEDKKKKKKKKESLLELVHDPPVYRILGSTHLDLKDLVLGQDSVHLLCDLGVLEDTCKTQQQQEQGKKLKDEKRKEEKKGKQGDVKGKGKAHKDGDAELDDRTPTPVQSLTVEMSIVLEKWHSTALALRTQPGTIYDNQHHTTHPSP